MYPDKRQDYINKKNDEFNKRGVPNDPMPTLPSSPQSTGGSDATIEKTLAKVYKAGLEVGKTAVILNVDMYNPFAEKALPEAKQAIEQLISRRISRYSGELLNNLMAVKSVDGAHWKACGCPVHTKVLKEMGELSE